MSVSVHLYEWTFQMADSGIRLLRVIFLLASALSTAHCPFAVAEQPSDKSKVAQLTQAIRQGDIEGAIDLARELDESSSPDTDLTLPLARLARTLEQGDRIEESALFYARAVAASLRPAAADLPEKTQVILRLAAGGVLAKSSHYRAAVSTVEPLLTAVFESVTEDQRKRAVSVCLSAGSIALSQSELSAAEEAYDLALQHCGEADRPTALLGDAWIAVLKRDQPRQAANKLAEFCRLFPAHHDTPDAVRTCIECCRHGDDSVRSSALPDSVQSWLVQKAIANDLETFDPILSVSAILVASERNEQAAWSNLVNHLSGLESGGQEVSDALSQLPEIETERLAIAILSPTGTNSVAREAAARWAARSNRWSLLASVAESQQPTDEAPSRSITVERLFAEALMQVGRVEESKPWWDHLVDSRSMGDFSTLLRCAEAETATGSDIELAQTRVAAARDAAGQNGSQLALADLLDAELQIRRTDFDTARATLETIVRTTDTNASVRCRAQWLIGESYYLQQNFGEAIDAYRIVEGIAGEDDQIRQWVSASLVQAAKSFEQLGRTREAALCYGNLLQRFPDSAHSRLARQRMAALDPEQPIDQVNDSSQTIRR